MITRKLTAFCAAIFLVTISHEANAARSSNIDQFCGDRYCGHLEQISVPRKRLKVKAHAVKKVRSLQVASIGNEPLHEASSSSGLVSQAEQYLGQTANQVGVRSSLWCSAFIRKLTNASGVDDRAISWLAKPRTSPSIGAIAVMRHHIGIVKGFDGGKVILISGNHGRKVGIGAYPRSRILAYVTP